MKSVLVIPHPLEISLQVSPPPSLCTRPQPPGLSQPRPCPPSWPSREAGEVTLLSVGLHNRPRLLSAEEGAGVGEREAGGSNYRLHNAACAAEGAAPGGWVPPIRAEAWGGRVTGGGGAEAGPFRPGSLWFSFFHLATLLSLSTYHVPGSVLNFSDRERTMPDLAGQML